MRRQNYLIIALSIAAGAILVTSIAVSRRSVATPSASAVRPLANSAEAPPRSTPSPAPFLKESVNAPDPVYGILIPNRLVPLKENVAWDPSWPRYPYRNVPRHPLEILASSSQPEPKIEAWLNRWQELTWPGGSATPADREQLAALLAASGLPVLALLEAGQSFDLAGDEATAAIWFRYGVIQGEKELADIPEKDARGRRLAEMLLMVQGLMWPAQNAGKIAAADTLSHLYGMLLVTLPATDTQRSWASIGRVESLILNGSIKQAVAETTSLLDPVGPGGIEFSPLQKIELHWSLGVLLYGQGQYREALPHLHSVADEPEHGHRLDATILLIETMARVGQAKEAIPYYRWWRASGGLAVAAPEVVDHLEQLMDFDNMAAD